MKKAGFSFVMCAAIIAAAASSLAAQSKPQVALLFSENTVKYFKNAYPGCDTAPYYTLGADENKRYFGGWTVVLGENNLNYKVIEDSDINPGRLQDFKVLILSNNFWLDRYQTKVIAEWVRGGGRLLATFGTGYSGMDGDFLKGGTNGLHELWGDPSGKVKSSFYLGNPWVKVRITRSEGPTGNFDAGDVLDYEYMANLLIKRPESSRDINAFFLFNDERTTFPAVFNNRHAQGLVVYYAFAPEYLVSLASDVAGHCANDNRYPGSQSAYGLIAAPLKLLMKQTLDFLLSQ